MRLDNRPDDHETPDPHQRSDGDLHCPSWPASSRAPQDGEIGVELEDGGVVTGDRLLVAVGRRPHTAELGLETVGLEPGRSIDVDDGLRVPGHEWPYAIGDVNGRALLTHMGKYQARVAAGRILGDEDAVAPGACDSGVSCAQRAVAEVHRGLRPVTA